MIQLEELSIADLIAMMNWFLDNYEADIEKEYNKKCWKACHVEWTRRRIELFGKCN